MISYIHIVEKLVNLFLRKVNGGKIMGRDIYKELCYLKEREGIPSSTQILENSYGLFTQIDEAKTIVQKSIMAWNLVRQFVLFQTKKSIENRQIASIIQKATRCSKDDIIYEEDGFAKNKYAKYVTGDLCYSASIAKESIESVELVWGSLNIKAYEKDLSNLKFVGGDFFTAQETLPSSLEYIVGDVHIKNVKDLTNLENCKFIGGTIYWANGEIKASCLLELLKRTKQRKK